MPNLIEGLQEEMNRVREVVKVYKSVPMGFIAAGLMEMDIAEAEHAIASGDTIAMIKVFPKLKQWEC